MTLLVHSTRGRPMLLLSLVAQNGTTIGTSVVIFQMFSKTIVEASISSGGCRTGTLMYHAFPTYQLMRDAGINARAIAGQWAHNYPDQPDRHSSLGSGYGGEAYPNMSRMDWAVELYGWFQYYLKDIGEEPEPMVQIQTHDGQWHVEETWPPEDMTWQMGSIGRMERRWNRYWFGKLCDINKPSL